MTKMIEAYVNDCVYYIPCDKIAYYAVESIYTPKDENMWCIFVRMSQDYSETIFRSPEKAECLRMMQRIQIFLCNGCLDDVCMIM